MLIVLAGCTSSREEKRSSASEPSRQRPDTRKVVVAFGDSLTAGFGVDPGQSYPDYLQKQLDARKLPYRIVNAGVSGDTTGGAVARLSTVLAEKPDVVVVEFGGNDGLRGLPVETTRANLDQIVSTIQKSGAKVLLAGITLPPNYGREYIKPFETMYSDIAKKYDVPFIPFLLLGVATNPELMQQDAIHPTAEGNRMVADTVFQKIQPLLK